MVPWSLVGPLVKASVDGVRAEMERELAERLAGLDTRIGDLRTDIQGKPGWGGIWTISGVVITTALAVLGLVYAFLMNGSDRSESALQTGIEIGKSLSEQQEIERGPISSGQIRPPASGDDQP
jgi:hypothetical protein